MKHLLKLGGMTPEEILHILDVADEYKRLHKDGVDPKDLQGKAVALVFAKNSTRCPPTAARRSPPMCWKPTPTKFSTRRRTASTWKRPCWRCCWRGNKSIAVRGAAGGASARTCRFFGGNGETGGCGGVKTPPYDAKDKRAAMARPRAGYARPLRGLFPAT